MKKSYLLLAVIAVVIFYLFKGKLTAAATNPLAFPSTLPLPPAANLGTSLSILPSPLPTYNAAPQGPLRNGSWIGGPNPPDAVVTIPYQAPTLGDSAPAASIAPDFSIGSGFFSAGSDTSSVFLA
jgi:hypothetical protein